MDITPSTRSSYIPAQGVQYLPTKAATHEALKKLVNDCLHGLRVYQPFQGDKVLVPLSRGIFFGRIHVNPVETGFLVFAPRHVPVFIHESLHASFIVRMRLSTSMHENTAIFTATLDRSDGYLWLEDVLFWQGQQVHCCRPFTERRTILKQFLDHNWMPDTRASGGLNIRIANYVSMDELKNHRDSTEWWAIDLCPDMPDRRRFRIRAVGGSAKESVGLVGEVRPVSGLPDVYEIWSADDRCVGHAALQELSLSKEIRVKIGKERVFAEVEWNADFRKFRVRQLVSSATPRSSTKQLLEAAHMADVAAVAVAVTDASSEH